MAKLSWHFQVSGINWNFYLFDWFWLSLPSQDWGLTVERRVVSMYMRRRNWIESRYRESLSGSCHTMNMEDVSRIFHLCFLVFEQFSCRLCYLWFHVWPQGFKRVLFQWDEEFIFHYPILNNSLNIVIDEIFRLNCCSCKVFPVFCVKVNFYDDLDVVRQFTRCHRIISYTEMENINLT